MILIEAQRGRLFLIVAGIAIEVRQISSFRRKFGVRFPDGGCIEKVCVHQRNETRLRRPAPSVEKKCGGEPQKSDRERGKNESLARPIHFSSLSRYGIQIGAKLPTVTIGASRFAGVFLAPFSLRGRVAW